jgi:hypothetical protein
MQSPTLEKKFVLCSESTMTNSWPSV